MGHEPAEVRVILAIRVDEIGLLETSKETVILCELGLASLAVAVDVFPSAWVRGGELVGRDTNDGTVLFMYLCRLFRG